MSVISAFCGFDGFTSPVAKPVMNSYWPTSGNEWPPNAIPRARMVIWVVRACAMDAATSTLLDRRLATPIRSSLLLLPPGARANDAPLVRSIMFNLLPRAHRDRPWPAESIIRPDSRASRRLTGGRLRRHLRGWHRCDAKDAAMQRQCN